MSERTHYVYEAYDADGLLLYIGCTGRPRDRYRAHMAGDPGGLNGWFHPFVTHWRVSGPYAKETALRIESQRIDERHPIWNGQTYRNPVARKAATNEYLAFHGVKWAEHPRYVNRVIPIPRRRHRKLRIVS